MQNNLSKNCKIFKFKFCKVYMWLWNMRRQLKLH